MSLELLKKAYPHIAQCIEPVAALIREIPKMKRSHFCELEARIGIGCRDATGEFKFKSGVEEDTSFISRVLCKLETSDAWTSTTDWVEQVDRYYLLPSGLEVRTTTESVVDKEGIARCIVSHAIKTNVGHVDIAWDAADPRALSATGDGTLLSVRVSVKQEEPAFEDELQDRVDDLHVVRIKQRKSFVYSSKDKGEWSVDATQVYEAATHTDADALLREGVVSSYELEVECKNAMDHLRACDNDYDRVAASILLKIADMFELASGPRLATTLNRLVVQ